MKVLLEVHHPSPQISGVLENLRVWDDGETATGTMTWIYASGAQTSFIVDFHLIDSRWYLDPGDSTEEPNRKR